ncbi:MAG: biopolymer transporter ExbD [Gammaproteobacteria bacterium]|nr:biopolymer transporter ExbD [Gammaproteobacteria bacterium]
MKFAASAEEEVSINLTPLIDIVFLLLIFFMVSTTFDKETKLEIALPEASSAPASEMPASRLILAITAKDEYALAIQSAGEASEGQKLEPQDLQSLFRAAFDKNPKVILVLKADAKTTHQAVVLALDAARKAGIERVMFAAQVANPQ